MAHCANPCLVCKISGDVMNQNNPPMMLPNGYVYGYNSLLSIRQDDKVVCPRTKEVSLLTSREGVHHVGPTSKRTPWGWLPTGGEAAPSSYPALQLATALLFLVTKDQ
ncbi:hypothetical protein P7K49_000804 [Saguinus oedipus]|uniref:RING-Gid-type domain-containing protein n=1 Tax=Saguinus oedipus TaxID=9490 RepID=A0ABQ9WCR8_SAGOE|nr:hypothetical protein P7K49_000804 [Saguinus oedipus]